MSGEDERSERRSPSGSHALAVAPAPAVDSGTPEESEDRSAQPPPEPRRRRGGVLELVVSSELGRDSSFPPPRARSTPPPAVGIESRSSERPSSAPAPSSERPSVRVLMGGRIPFGRREERMIHSLARTVGVVGLASMMIAGLSLSQWMRDAEGALGIVVAVLSAAVGIWSLLAGWHLQRVVVTDDDAHNLVAAFGHLRGVFLLKAIALFLLLASSCFVFSIVASLIALL